MSLALATACLGYDDQRAAKLYAGLTAGNDVREAWLGLANVRRRLDDAAGAASAMAELLSRHVPDLEFAALFDAIALEVAAPGWCGLSGADVLTVRPTGLRVRVAVAPPARPSRVMGAGAVPAGWREAGTLIVTAEDGRQLLGSPIDVRAILRTAGCVASRDGGLDGWAWHPGYRTPIRF